MTSQQANPQNSGRILNGAVNFPLCLAPMVGLSHVVMRQVVQSYLPRSVRTIWPTEMLNSRRLPHQEVGNTLETFRMANEEFLVPQILGNEEEPILKSVKKLEAWGAGAIDINMGCPVQKALRHNYGVALMGDPDYAAKVVEMTTRHAQVPVSVKLRAAENNDYAFLLNFVQGLIQAGASWITLHPRTAEQKRRGRADWQQIARLRSEVNVPVIGNGDVQTCDDVLQMLHETQCDMVMVGRALTARPWLVWQVGESLGFLPPEGRQGSAPRTPEEEGAEYGRSLLLFVQGLRSYFPEELGLKRLRFYVRTGLGWIDFGEMLKGSLEKATTYDAAEAAICSFFSRPVSMSAKTNLRT